MQPQAPGPDYSFILQGNQKPKKRFSMPKPNLPKPIAIGLLVVILLFLLIIVYALLTRSSSPSGLATVAARAQEISRVSALVQQQATDTNLQSLAATTQTTMNSDVAQIQNYLTSSGGKKISSGALALDKDSSVDSQVQSAAQTGSLASFYNKYLKDNVATYQTDLQTA